MQSSAGQLQRYELDQGSPITIITQNPDTKFCTGWYDIQAHENHPCEDGREVGAKYDSCFACRTKTGFNPAFYHAESISDTQAAYNKQPHSVYVAYFGDGLCKAGIMSDSRGLERVYEQGALLYVNLGSFGDAYAARELEAELIQRGLRNSVSKKQKERVFYCILDPEQAINEFAQLLASFDLPNKDIVSNVGHFFFGNHPRRSVIPISDQPTSGNITGLVGRFLIVENGGRLYGQWLDHLFGYAVNIENQLVPFTHEPEQVSLF